MIDFVKQPNLAPTDEGKGTLTIFYKKVSEAKCIAAIIKLDKERVPKTMQAIAEKMGVGTVDILESMRADKNLIRLFITGKEIADEYKALRPTFLQLSSTEITIEELAKKLRRNPANMRAYMLRHPDIPEAFNFIIVK